MREALPNKSHTLENVVVDEQSLTHEAAELFDKIAMQYSLTKKTRIFAIQSLMP